jgi:hypothetical protein
MNATIINKRNLHILSVNIMTVKLADYWIRKKFSESYISCSVTPEKKIATRVSQKTQG